MIVDSALKHIQHHFKNTLIEKPKYSLGLIQADSWP